MADDPAPAAGERAASRRPRIGVSANYLAPVRDRRFYIGKALHYAEEQMLHYVWRHGGMPVIVAMVGDGEGHAAHADHLDGLILSGGEDVSPTHYGESPKRPEWVGNPARDAYEMGLVEAFLERDKPILGICRGIQILNVFQGGSLYQDILEDGAVERTHRDPEVYDLLEHVVVLHRPSYLYDLYGVEQGRVNTVHHQAIRDLGDGLEVMAHSDDGLIEAVRLVAATYVVGIQWHPEWLDPTGASGGFLAPGPLMDDFIARVRRHASA